VRSWFETAQGRLLTMRERVAPAFAGGDSMYSHVKQPIPSLRAKRSNPLGSKSGLLRRGACHRARIRATRWLLAMTRDIPPPSRGAIRPSCARNVRPELRAWGMPGARRTRSRAWCVVNTRVSHHGHAGSPGIPRAMVLTVSFVLSPVIGLCCHRRLRIESANLTPASRRQDHTTSPSAGSALVRSTTRVHRIPSRVRDDRETPPQVGRDGENQ
jgi:hypothetical protein